MAIHGKNGNVSVDGGATYLDDLNNWTVNENADAEETTDFQSDGKREYDPGLTDWDGSFAGRWNTAKANSISAGDVIDVQFELDANNYYSGEAIVTGVSTDEPVDGMVEASYDVQGSGELSLITE